MNWNCTQTEERLSDFLDGLMAPEESAAFSSHAARCADCAKLLRQVRGLVTQMKAVEPLPVPALLNKRILDATLGSRAPREGWKRFFAWTPILWSPRFAMGAITVAAVFAIVLHTAGVTPKKFKRADLSPVSMARSANRQVHLVYARSAKFVNDLRVVYEIQSALQRTTEPPPSTNPEPQPKSESPSTTPDEKSQQAPRPRSQMRNEPMLAFVMASEFNRSLR
jgi:anti-sigma factor RsiW